MGDVCGVKIARALRKRPKLQTLNLSRNLLSNRTLFALSDYIEVCCQPRHHSRSWKSFPGRRLPRVVKSLVESTAAARNNGSMRCDKIARRAAHRRSGVEWIRRSWRSCPVRSPPEQRSSCFNRPTPLADCFQQVLTHLGLSSNAITDCGLESLCQGLKENDGLVEIDLSSNPITDAVIATLVAALSRNQGTSNCIVVFSNLTLSTGILFCRLHETHMGEEHQKTIGSLLASR